MAIVIMAIANILRHLENALCNVMSMFILALTLEAQGRRMEVDLSWLHIIYMCVCVRACVRACCV